MNRAEALLDRRVDEISAADVAGLVAELAKTRKRETIRKTVMALAMVFDFAGVEPNPARDKRTVKLPREQRQEIKPPTADHLLAVHRILPARYRLSLVVLDATGMRLGELERLTWGDVDEQRGRWAGVHRGRRPGVLAARPAASPDLAPAPRWPRRGLGSASTSASAILR